MQVGFIESHTMASALVERADLVILAHKPAQLATVASEIADVAAWTDAAIRHGVPASQAATLVTETMAGTAALLTQTDTLALRRGVTSPATDAVVRP
jgi:pyrroline-5-carboxylate reductase